MSWIAWRRGILIQRFLNSPRISKSGVVIGLGKVNLSGNGGRVILSSSAPRCSTVSLPISVSVMFSWIDSVEVSIWDWGGVLASIGKMVHPNLSLSSLHYFYLVLEFGFSMI